MDLQDRRGPEAVLVERESRDAQRIVDADDLAGEQLAVPVDREVGREVRGLARIEPGRLEPIAPEDEEAGRPDRLHRDRLAPGDDEAFLDPEPARDGGRHEEQDEAGVREQRRHLRVLVAIAVDVTDPVAAGLLAHPEAVPAEDRGERRGVYAAEGRPIGQPRVVIRVGLGDADVARLSPQAGRPVERADDDRDEEKDERAAEPRRAEDVEDLGALEEIDDGGAEDRVVAIVDLAHLGQVVGAPGAGTEREARQLADDEPHGRHDPEHDDLEHRELDRGAQPPERAAETRERIEPGRAGGAREVGRRRRDDPTPSRGLPRSSPLAPGWEARRRVRRRAAA